MFKSTFKKPRVVLGINPGATYVGIAVLYGTDLQEWCIKTIKGQWSSEKADKHIAIISECIERYAPDAIAIKALHPARSSTQLDELVARIAALCKRKRILCRSYTIKAAEECFAVEGNITNKRQLAEMVAARYPVLFHELYREKSRKNPYHMRMFEAVALATCCVQEIDIRP